MEDQRRHFVWDAATERSRRNGVHMVGSMFELDPYEADACPKNPAAVTMLFEFATSVGTE